MSALLCWPGVLGYPLAAILTMRAENSGLAVHDVLTADSLGGISRVNHELRIPYNRLVVIVGVVGNDQHAVVVSQTIQRLTLHLKVIFSTFTDHRYVRIVVGDHGALTLQLLNDRQSRRFAKVIDVPLVRNPEDHDPGAIYRLSMLIECRRDRPNDVETPCWVSVVNFAALDLLGKDQGRHSPVFISSKA